MNGQPAVSVSRMPAAAWPVVRSRAGSGGRRAVSAGVSRSRPGGGHSRVSGAGRGELAARPRATAVSRASSEHDRVEPGADGYADWRWPAPAPSAGGDHPGGRRPARSPATDAEPAVAPARAGTATVSGVGGRTRPGAAPGRGRRTGRPPKNAARRPVSRLCRWPASRAVAREREGNRGTGPGPRPGPRRCGPARPAAEVQIDQGAPEKYEGELRYRGAVQEHGPVPGRPAHRVQRLVLERRVGRDRPEREGRPGRRAPVRSRGQVCRGTRSPRRPPWLPDGAAAVRRRRAGRWSRRVRPLGQRIQLLVAARGRGDGVAPAWLSGRAGCAETRAPWRLTYGGEGVYLTQRFCTEYRRREPDGDLQYPDVRCIPQI